MTRAVVAAALAVLVAAGGTPSVLGAGESVYDSADGCVRADPGFAAVGTVGPADAQVTIYTTAGDADAGRSLLAVAGNALSFLRPFFPGPAGAGHMLDDASHVYLDAVDGGLDGVAARGCTEHGRMDVVVDPHTSDSLASVLTHELAHVLQGGALGDAGFVDNWFEEATAEYLAHRLYPDPVATNSQDARFFYDSSSLDVFDRGHEYGAARFIEWQAQRLGDGGLAGLVGDALHRIGATGARTSAAVTEQVAAALAALGRRLPDDVASFWTGSSSGSRTDEAPPWCCASAATSAAR